MRRETADLIGSGLLLASLVLALFATLAPPAGASVASGAVDLAASASAGTERGLALFYAKGCVSCHSRSGVTGGATFGPDLTGLAARAGQRKAGMDAKAYVHESITKPSAFIVPGYEGGLGMPDLGLNDGEVDALIAFLLGAP